MFDKTNREQLDALREARTRLNEEAREMFEDDAWRREQAQEITREVYKGFDHENLVETFTQVQRLPIDGVATISEVRGLKAFWLSRGGYIEESTLTRDIMTIERDMAGFHVREFEDKLETNFAESAATLVERGTQRLDAVVNQRVLAVFQQAVPDSSPYYLETTSGVLPALNQAIREVADESPSGEIAIVGRRTMTDQIVDELSDNNSYSAFLAQTNEELVRRGVLQSYRSTPIVPLRNFKDENDVPFFPANELWVIARDAGETVFWAGPKTKEFREQDNWYWHYLLRMDVGFALPYPERARRIVDDSIPA